jgi:ABC-2 type transport system permease protein
LLLGRALLHDPELILVDEGTHALDPEGAEGLRTLLRARTEAGACLVFVTHNEDEARALATRTVRLEAGHAVAMSDPTKVPLAPSDVEGRSPTLPEPSGASTLPLAFAWTRKATLEELSYRGYLTLEAVGGLVTLLGLFYFSRLVGSSHAGLVGNEGYFAFACVGLAAYLPARAAQAELARQVRAAQLVGLLEPLAAAPPRLPAQLLAMALQPTLGAIVRAGLTLLAGSVLFGLRLDPAGLGWTLLALGLAAMASAGLGLCSAAVVLHVRRSDPVAYLLDAAAWLGSGLLFPVALLPGWAQALSEWLPATHALRLARATLLPGGAPSPVWAELGTLAALATLAVALGWALLSLAVTAARRTGALGIS